MATISSGKEASLEGGREGGKGREKRRK